MADQGKPVHAGAETVAATGAVTAPPPPWARYGVELRRLTRRFARSKSGVIGGALVLLLVATALLAPWIAPYDPLQMAAGGMLEAPSSAHLFGTDEFGRDLFSRVIYGAALTLRVGLVAVGISLTTGFLIGIVAGYARGWAERILMRSADVLFSFTETLIALAAVAVLGPSLNNAIIAVGIAQVPFYARVTYSVVLVETSRPYIDAGKAIGASHLRMIFLHVLPNVVPPMIVVASLGVSTAVLTTAGLSYLGLGAQPPLPEWGYMLAAGQNYFRNAPWIMIFPGVAIALAVLGFNLLGDGIREVLDPRQRDV